MKRDWETVARRLAGYIDLLMDGDTHMIGDMNAFLKDLGWMDEDGYMIYEEDE